MRLIRIEIENFKGIGKRQVIDLKPITLLFGPNSAGKSTILQALHYLREILERGNVDPDVTIAGGLMDLGGFATLVHNHELDRAIHLKLVIDLSDEQGAEELPLNAGLSFGEPEFAVLPIRYLVGESAEYQDYAIVQEIGLEVEIRWSERTRTPYVSSLSIEINSEQFATIKSPPQKGRAQLTDFSFAHPLVQMAIHPDDILKIEAGEGDIPDEEGDPFSTPFGLEIWELSREMSADSSKKFDGEFRIAVETQSGALPDIDRPIPLDLVETDINQIRQKYASGTTAMRLSRKDEAQATEEFEQEKHRRSGLVSLLSEMVLGPARIVRNLLAETTYIGPLREIPSRSYRPQASPDEARWSRGFAAWDLLYRDEKGKLLETVNNWLSSEERLKTGYSLERIEFKEIPVPSRFAGIFGRGINEDDLGELQELFESLKTRTEIALRDSDRGILVAPGDVGVGVSQMVPVVVACLRTQDGILVMEQPELHVHPAIQVGMGDLFINAVQPDESRVTSGKTLLVETHSEHIILRLLRRIREKTENELPPGVLGLEPDGLSVVYVETGESGVKFRP
ncbi:MAG: AAA family ATPase, partial [Verrucomicrobia bacterium]|nr:AAA family ATPase [Verrucomicrobiota bacterium]